MARITFYEKPGCGSNARQRALLEAAGHDLVVRDILSEPWTQGRLLTFFAGLPVADWFNQAAPAVKSGAVKPDGLSADEALALMLKDPILIRRPLLESEGRRMAGFAPGRLMAFLGDAFSEEEADDAIDGCSRPHVPGGCPDPEERPA